MRNLEERTSPGNWRTIFGILGLIGGLWLVLAPFVLGYGSITTTDPATKKPVSAELGAVTMSDIICGILLIVLVGFCLLSARNPATARARYYANIAVIIVGVYLLAAPYIFDLLKVAEYINLDRPNTNDQLLGLLTIILGGFALEREFFWHGRASSTYSPTANTM